MTFTDTLSTLLIIGFLILLVWSRFERKRIIDLLVEIKDKLGTSIPTEEVIG